MSNRYSSLEPNYDNKASGKATNSTNLDNKKKQNISKTSTPVSKNNIVPKGVNSLVSTQVVPKKEINSDIVKFIKYANHLETIRLKAHNIIGPIIIKSNNIEDCAKALDFVCSKYNTDSDDWVAQIESYSIVIDEHLKKAGIEPLFSFTYKEITLLDDLCKIQPIKNVILLPYPVALVCEWKNDTKWEKTVSTIMRTTDDYDNTIDKFNSDVDKESKLTLPLKGKELMAKSIFEKLLNSGKKTLDDSVVIETETKTVSNIVAQFNSLYPVWSFVRVDGIKMDPRSIEVPFIRTNNKSINDININLKDTKTNQKQGIRPIDNNFRSGYIPYLVQDFINGKTPDYISSIVFSKTIAVSGRTYYKGDRVRILVNNTKYIPDCKRYLDTEFIDKFSDKCDYSKSIVRISVPAKV